MRSIGARIAAIRRLIASICLVASSTTEKVTAYPGMALRLPSRAFAFGDALRLFGPPDQLRAGQVPGVERSPAPPAGQIGDQVSPVSGVSGSNRARKKPQALTSCEFVNSPTTSIGTFATEAINAI
jgi:hypothetical protein